MKKIIFLLLLTMTIVVLISACAPSTGVETTPEPGQTEETGAGKKYDLVYATNPTGTGNYTIAAAQGTLVTGETGTVNVIVQPTSGPEGIAEALKSGQAQIGIMSSKLLMSLYGENAEKDIRALFGGGVTPFSFVVKDNSGIKSIADLKGKRVTYVGLSSTYVRAAEALLKAYDIDPEKDVEALKMSVATAGFNDLVDGRTDAVIGSIAGSKMEELNSKIKPLVLGVDPDKVQLVCDIAENYFIPYETTSDVPGCPAGTLIVGALSQVSALASLEDEAAYLFTKTIMESYDKLAAVANDLKEWKPEVAVRKEVRFPYHPGAVAYYKEAGMWSDEMEAWQNETLAALANASNN